MSNLNFGMNILPKTTDTYTLGSNEYKWNIFANQINGVNVSTIINSGNGLPTVTSTDNGKVLRVVNGQWAVASLPNVSEVSW